MAALSDTPTPHMPVVMMPELLQRATNLEQGVLHDENGEYGSDDNRHGIMQCDSNRHPPETENGGSCNSSNTDFHGEIQIKSEPPIDIDDCYENINEDNNSVMPAAAFAPTAQFRQSARSPIIRLTPTNKLMPTRNPTNPKRRYECPYEECTKSYGKSSHLRSHLTWHTGIKPFVCKAEGCGKGFTRSDELNRHVRTHTGEKPFECVQCNKKFSRSDHLTKHLATHSKQMAAGLSPVSPHQVTTKRSRAYKQLSYNPLNMMPEQNLVEGMHFMAGFMTAKAVPSQLEPTSLERSPMKFPKIEPPELEPPVVEQQCFRNYSPENLTEEPNDTQSVEVKIKYETPDESGDDSNQHIIPDIDMNQKKYGEPEIYVKDEPHPEYEDDADADGEEENDIDNNENQPDDDAIMPEANLPPLVPMSIIQSTYLCSTPPPPPSALQPPPPLLIPISQPKRATKKLSNDDSAPRPFPCSECSKKFKRLDDLNRHVRTHTGEKPFACNECEKRFMRSDHLKKHMNTHTRIR